MAMKKMLEEEKKKKKKLVGSSRTDRGDERVSGRSVVVTQIERFDHKKVKNIGLSLTHLLGLISSLSLIYQ